MKHLRRPARWLAVLALVFHVVWVPVHLLTEAHSDTGLTHHHGHSHGESDTHSHTGDEDQHHFTGDHESKFLSKRQALLFAPVLVAWQPAVLTPPVAIVRQAAVRAEESPPPADFSPPSGPRAPPPA